MIEGYVGLLGAGKTMLAVQHALGLAKRRNAVLLSNIKVEGAGVEFHQLGVGEDGIDLEELRSWQARTREDGGRGLVLLIDEVGILMPARFWQSFPIDLIYTLSQSRKMRLDLVYTSQDIEMVDSMLRRLTQWVYRVKCFPSPTNERRERGRRPWFFLVEQFRPAHVNVGESVQRKRRLSRRWLRYRRGFEGCYDTDELVAPAVRLSTGSSRGSKSRTRGSDGPSPVGAQRSGARPVAVEGPSGSRGVASGDVPDAYQPLGLSASTARNAQHEDGTQRLPSGLSVVTGAAASGVAEGSSPFLG
jgi:hypothetical protein